MYAQNSILCQFGNLEICPNFANPYLTQFSSISGGNCIIFGLALFFLLEGGADSADGTDGAASAATFAGLRVDTIVENDFVLPFCSLIGGLVGRLVSLPACAQAQNTKLLVTEMACRDLNGIKFGSESAISHVEQQRERNNIRHGPPLHVLLQRGAAGW